MGSRPQVSILHICLSMVLLAVACGQKSGVADIPSSTLGLPSTPSSEQGLTLVDSGEHGTAPGYSFPTGTESIEGSGGSPVPGSTPITGFGGDQPSSSPSESPMASRDPPSGGDTTGVTGSSIKIGIHVPFAQGPPNAAASVRLYWRNRTIEGRKVELVVTDDGYSPGRAHDACRSLIEEERVFAIIGFAGPYQIQACARLAHSAGVPYLTLGNSEALLAGLGTQFSISMPYPRQAALVADLLVDELEALRNRNGFLRVAGGVAAESQRYIDEMTRRGATLHASMRLPADATYQEWEQAALHFKQRRIKNVIFGGSPLHFSNFSTAAARNGYFPRLAGPGFTVTVDEFLHVTCQINRAGHGALFFSPFPAYEDHQRWDPSFRAAGGSNDVDWIFWALSKAIDGLISLPGRNLTRERLLWHVARANRLDTGIMPPISFAPGDHFSNHSMHLLRANCSKQRWETYRSYVKP